MAFPTAVNNLVAGLIRNQEGKVLLINNQKGGWKFPEGQVQNGEDHIEALKRVVNEKANINISVSKLVGIYSNIRTEIHCGDEIQVSKDVYIDFIGTMNCDELRTREESIDVGWFNKEDALSNVTHPIIKERLEYMFNYNDSIHMLFKKIVKGL